MSPEEAQVGRGMQLAASLPEIMPDDADERVKPVYDSIQQSLRVPFVNLIFRVLANYPDYLVNAWQQITSTVRSVAFEGAADELRAAAGLDGTPGRLEKGIGVSDALHAFNNTIHYVLPKLLLVVTLLDREGTGSEEIVKSRSKDLPGGIAPGTAKVDMVDPQKSNARVSDLFNDIKASHGYPLVPSYYRGLAQSPDLLEALWAQLRPIVGTEAYEARKLDLVKGAAAQTKLLAGSGPVDIRVAADDREAIGDLLAAFRRKFIPEMLIEAVAVKGMLDGPQAALRSPFSIST